MFVRHPFILGLIVAALLSCILVTECQENGSKNFFAFGGSVRWQKSGASVKEFVSQLRIHVHSLPDETLRQIVNVLPNGAFSIIVSDKARYRIRLSAPQGWNFIPADGHKVDLNDKTQQDHMNYLFDLTGFDVSGQVVTAGMNTGPSDLVVSATLNGVVHTQTKTFDDGRFVLTSVPPGSYVITVGDSGSGSDAQVSRPITVSTNSLKLEEPLVLQVGWFAANSTPCVRVIRCARG